MAEGRYLVSLYSDDGLVKTHNYTATNDFKECSKILNKYREHELKFNRKITGEEIFDRELQKWVYVNE